MWIFLSVRKLPQIFSKIVYGFGKFYVTLQWVPYFGIIYFVTTYECIRSAACPPHVWLLCITLVYFIFLIIGRQNCDEQAMIHTVSSANNWYIPDWLHSGFPKQHFKIWNNWLKLMTVKHMCHILLKKLTQCWLNRHCIQWWFSKTWANFLSEKTTGKHWEK